MRQQVITFILGEVAHDVRGEIFRPQAIKSAPAYSQASLAKPVVIGQETPVLDGQPVRFELRGYPPDVLLIRTIVEVETLFDKGVFEMEERILRQAQRILEDHGGNPQFAETYSIFVVSEYDGEPEQFLAHAPMIASLLKSERLELDPDEVDYTLRAQIKYARNDLSIIDWDGAFLFDPEGDFDEEVELLTLANLQLLRHRILDRQLEDRLAQVVERVQVAQPTGRMFNHRELARDLAGIVRTRMLSISDLQRIERDIKLIGDWYSARFFELVSRKFKLDEWRSSIRTKLESIEDVYSIVAANFSVSGKHRAEWVQIIAFFILQAGWFLLIILEFFYFTR